MGRHRRRYPVESACKLDVAQLRAWGYFTPGRSSSRGRLTWAYPWGDMSDAAIGLDLSARSVTVDFEEPGEQPQQIELVSSPQPFGGVRWLFRCPITGRRCRVLYLPNGGQLFASRQAYRLVYRSQQLDAEGRAYHRGDKLAAALGAEVGRGEIVKPKGMHRRTFERKAAALQAAWAAADRFFLDRLASVPDWLWAACGLREPPEPPTGQPAATAPPSGTKGPTDGARGGRASRA